MANDPSLLFNTESEEEIYQRLIDDFEDNIGGRRFNIRPGSNLYTLLYPSVTEHIRIKDFAEKLSRLGFLQYTQGDFLDAKAAEYGALRRDAVQASVIVEFVGIEGTEIPFGTLVSTTGTDEMDGVTFVTQETVVIPVSGLIEVVALASDPGVAGNVNPGEINQMVSGIDGVTFVTNNAAGTGGLDIEDDESLRQSALTRAQSIAQSGNKATYTILAMDDPEVGTVYVEDFWDQSNGMSGNGTARIVVGGNVYPWVSPQAIYRLQNQIDPTILPLAFFENESWVGGTEYSTNPIEGYASRILTAAASTTTTMSLLKNMNLSAFDSGDDEVWIELRRLSLDTTIDSMAVRFIHPNGDSAAYTQATIPGSTINALDNITSEGLLKIQRSDFVDVNGTDTFSWAAIGAIEIELSATSVDEASMMVDGLRIRRAKGDFPDGQALVGVQILVRSARALFFDVEADVELTTGMVVTDVYPAIEQSINEYFESATPGSIVRISEVANAIHDSIGVIDYSNIRFITSMGTTTDNVDLAQDERPVLNTLTLTQV